MSWAIYHVLAIPSTVCHCRESAGLFANQISPDFILQCKRCILATAVSSLNNGRLTTLMCPPLIPMHVEYPEDDTLSGNQNMKDDEDCSPADDNAMNCSTGLETHPVCNAVIQSPPLPHARPGDGDVFEEAMELKTSDLPPLTSVPPLLSLQDHFLQIMQQLPLQEDIKGNTPSRLNFLKACDTWWETLSAPNAPLPPKQQWVILFTWAMETHTGPAVLKL
jgi:hypothetical protein